MGAHCASTCVSFRLLAYELRDFKYQAESKITLVISCTNSQNVNYILKNHHLSEIDIFQISEENISACKVSLQLLDRRKLMYGSLSLYFGPLFYTFSKKSSTVQT